MSQAPIPNQPYFNGIIYNPDFFATENGVSLDYATQNYLARAGTNPTSIATKTTFTGEVDANNISITTNGSFGGNVSTNSLSTSSDVSIGGNLKITSSQASTNTTTGALQVAGGCGIGGSLNIGGSISVSGLSNYIQTYDSIYGYCRQTQGTAEFDYLTECNAYVLNPYNKNPYNGTNVMAFGQNKGTASPAQFYFNGVSLQAPATVGIGKPATTNAIDISGNGVISGNLTVNNSFTSNNLTTTGNAVVGGNLQVTSDSTMNGNLTVNNNLNSNLLTTTGDSSIGGVLTARSDFYVLGQSTFTTIYPNQIGVRNPTPAYDVDITGSGHLTGSLYVGSKLGVGTTNPTQNLHVVGSSYISNSLGIAKSNPSYTLDVSGIINTNNNLYVAGNIGIGKNNPSYLLDVNGIINTNNDLYASGKIGIKTISPSYDLDVSGVINTNYNLYVGGSIGIQTTTPSYPLDVNVTDSNNHSIHALGQIICDSAIGIGTPAPSSQLDVSGDSTFRGRIVSTLNAGLNGAIPDASYGLVVNGPGLASTGSLHCPQNLVCDATISTRWQTVSTWFSIGKLNNQYPLDVSGDTQTNNLRFPNTGIIYAKNTAGTFIQTLVPCWSDNITYLSYGSAGFNIRNSTFVNTMFFNNSNLVGINTTLPTSQLDVSGIIHTNNSIQSPHYDLSYSAVPTLSSVSIGNSTSANYASLPITLASSTYYAITFTNLPIGIYLIQAYVLGSFTVTTNPSTIKLGLSTASTSLTSNNYSQQYMPVMSSQSQSLNYSFYLSNTATTTYYIVFQTSTTTTGSVTVFNGNFIRQA